MLKGFSRAAPVVLVVDDLHWADEPSLLLLRFLVTELANERVLIVGAYRDFNPVGSAPVQVRLRGLAEATERISLRGLSRSDISTLIDATADHAVPPDLVEAIYRSTAGNAFFVAEVVRQLAADLDIRRDVPAGSARLRIPERVKDAIDQRIDQLGEPVIELLRMASVFGEQFADASVQVLLNITAEQSSELIKQAVRAQLLTSVAELSDTYCFTHSLIRDHLYEQLPAGVRRALHGRAGAIMEERSAAGAGAASEIARHFLAAETPEDLRKGIAFSITAGQAALRSLGYEQAADHFRAALAAMPVAGIGRNDHHRCQVLLMAADALVRAGNAGDARALSTHWRSSSDLTTLVDIATPRTASMSPRVTGC